MVLMQGWLICNITKRKSFQHEATGTPLLLVNVRRPMQGGNTL